MKIKNKIYVDDRICNVKELMTAELKAIREAVSKVEATNSRAVDKVETNSNARFEAQNEWRGQFKDQTAGFATKREVDQIKDQNAGFVTRRELWAAVIAVIMMVIAAIKVFQ